MTRLKPVVVAVGNVVIDAHYPVSPAEFDARGFVQGRFSHVSRDELDESLKGLEAVVRRAGGSAINKARVLAAMGVPVCIVGITGADITPLWEWASRPPVRDATAPLRAGTAAGAHITDGERWTVITAPGSFADFDRIDPSELVRDFGEGTILTVEAYLLNNAPWLTSLVRLAAASGVRIHLDLGAPPLIARHRDELAPLIAESVEVVSGTEAELRTLLETGDGTDVRADVVARRLAVNVAVVKRGARGAEVARAGSTLGGRTIRAAGSGRETTPPWSVGCGDVLDGVILAGLATNRPLEIVVPAATAAAADASRRPFAAVDEVPVFPR